MAETLGSLCDKLTIVKLKLWHTADEQRLQSLTRQAVQLTDEIDTLFADAVSGRLDASRVTFPSNKVFDVGERTQCELSESFGEVFGELARINCELWHEQEKVYEIQRCPESHSDAVSIVRRLGELNIERTFCIDAIDEALLKKLEAAPRPAR